MYHEEDLLPISALQHLRFCPRRAALIHVEGLWAENRYTAEGNRLHRRAHDPVRGEARPGLRVARGMMLRSFTLGLFGKADVIEFHERPEPSATIIEYKRGKPKPRLDQAFHIQLCAQAICLEQMMPHLSVIAAIYFGEVRRRVDVPLGPGLREQTQQSANQLHQLIAAGITPQARYERKCDRCSLKTLCMPQAMRVRATARHYLSRVITSQQGADTPDTFWT